eukprot:4022836-Pyramimonas_sp.AAC.1
MATHWKSIKVNFAAVWPRYLALEHVSHPCSHGRCLTVPSWTTLSYALALSSVLIIFCASAGAHNKAPAQQRAYVRSCFIGCHRPLHRQWPLAMMLNPSEKAESTARCCTVDCAC